MIQRIGKYQVKRLIGKGGMAEVYEVEGLGPGGFKNQLCLKKIRKEYAERPDFIKSFESEARIVADMHHPNIIQVFDFDRHEGELFLVMEYVDGLELSTILSEAAGLVMHVSLDFTIYLMEGLLAALNHAHNHRVNDRPAPVIHRDISPHNILISTEGVVKPADFGIAKAKGISATTQTGVIKGKLSYLSPEQARGDKTPIGPASDLFSAGLVLWESITSERLFKATMEHQVVARVLSFTEASLPFLSSELNQFLAGLLAPDPADRFADAEAALRALKKVSIQPCSRMDAARMVRKLKLHIERDNSSEQTQSNPIIEPRAEVTQKNASQPSPKKKMRPSLWNTSITRTPGTKEHRGVRSLIIPLVAGVIIAAVTLVLILLKITDKQEEQPRKAPSDKSTPAEIPSITATRPSIQGDLPSTPSAHKNAPMEQPEKRNETTSIEPAPEPQPHLGKKREPIRQAGFEQPRIEAGAKSVNSRKEGQNPSVTKKKENQ